MSVSDPRPPTSSSSPAIILVVGILFIIFGGLALLSSLPDAFENWIDQVRSELPEPQTIDVPSTTPRRPAPDDSRAVSDIESDEESAPIAEPSQSVMPRTVTGKASEAEPEQSQPQPQPSVPPVERPRQPIPDPFYDDGDEGTFSGGATDISETELVRQIQKELKRLGYYADEIDGQVGRRTTMAIQTFEIVKNLPLTGKPSWELLDLLVAEEKTAEPEKESNATPTQKANAPPPQVRSVQEREPEPKAPKMNWVVSEDGSGDSTTFFNVMALVPPGGRIFVKPGTYRSPSIINKEVHIQGDGERSEIILTGAGEGSMISISGTTASIQNLTLQHSRTDDQGGVIEVWNGNAVIKGNRIESSGNYGVRIFGAGDVTVAENTFRDVKGYAIEVSMSNALVDKNDIQNSKNGILVTNSAKPLVTDNTISDMDGVGIHLSLKAEGTYYDNEISRTSEEGVLVESRSAPTFRRNTIHSIEHHGIRVVQAGGEFSDNIIKDTGSSTRDLAAVFIESRSDPEFTKNTVTGDGVPEIRQHRRATPTLRGNEVHASKRKCGSPRADLC